MEKVHKNSMNSVQHTPLSESFQVYLYKTVVLYEHETWSHIGNERRLSVLESIVLRRIFGCGRGEVIGG
jgi:hypothetical protein